MLNHYFTNDLIRKYTVIFGSLFDKMYVKRDAEDGSQAQKIKIPLNYGPSEKVLARITQQPELEKPVAIELPRMAFTLDDIQYDPSRQMNALNRLTCNGNGVGVPAPYNFFWTLSIMATHEIDAGRIIEQILPFFRPFLSIPTKLIPELGVKADLPLSILNIQKSDNWEGSFKDRRTLVWNITFKLDAYLFGPVSQEAVIKRVETNIADALDVADHYEQMVLTGGQTEGGLATNTRPPSVPYKEVDPFLPYDFIKDIYSEF